MKRGRLVTLVIVAAVVVFGYTFLSREDPPASAAAKPVAVKAGQVAQPRPGKEGAIPPIVHQTYKTARLQDWVLEKGHNNRTQWFLSWTSKNPGFDHRVLDDSAADAFIRTHFDKPVVDAWAKMPLMVLKADLLRYAQLWVQGGIYADSDAECLQSLENWLGEYSDAEFVVSVEWYKDSHNFAEARYHVTQLVQWTFAARAQHPAFINTINDIVQTVDKSSMSFLKDKDNVESIGGPMVFTRHVEAFLKSNGESLESMTKNIGDKRFYYPKSKVLVLPMFSFMSQLGTSKTTGFVNHFFGGTYLDNGWKNAPQ